jgi:hypothetical protein
MPNPLADAEQDLLEDLLDSAQCLAFVVISYPSYQRDDVMQRIGGLLTNVACEAGCSREMAFKFEAAMEQVIYDYVAEIEASGARTSGTA